MRVLRRALPTGTRFGALLDAKSATALPQGRCFEPSTPQSLGEHIR